MAYTTVGKTLTKEQKKKETARFLKAEIKGDITRLLMKKLDKAIASGAIPEHWMQKGHHFLSKAIIDSFCRDRPYSMLNKEEAKEADNLHKFI